MTASLRKLARLFGVQTDYRDVARKRQVASAESLLEAARLLGAQVATFQDVSGAVRAQEILLWSRVLEPVIVARPPEPATFAVRIPARHATGRLACSLRLEDRQERRWSVGLRSLATERAVTVGGNRYVVKRVALPARLPLGYHELVVELAGEVHRSRVIAAPMRAWWPDDPQWGAFLPLYSMHSSESWGAGDFSDLSRFREWIGQLGGGVVSILPVLAAFLDEPFDPSPYAPVSRLFWNETYVDPREAPELAASEPAQRLLASPAFRRRWRRTGRPRTSTTVRNTPYAGACSRR